MTSRERQKASFENLPAYALSALDKDAQEEVEKLLAQSPAAQAELRELMEGAEALGRTLPAVQMPPGMRDRILSSIRREAHSPGAVTQDAPEFVRPGQPPDDILSRILELFTPARLAVASSIAVLITAGVAAGMFGMQTNRLQQETEAMHSEINSLESELVTVRASRTELEDTLASLKSELVSNDAISSQREADVSRLMQSNQALQDALRDQMWLTYVSANRSWQASDWLTGGTSAPSAHATIVVKSGTQDAVLLVGGLTQLQPGSSYQLWLSSGGRMMPVVNFQVDEAGTARVPFTFSGDIFSYDAAAVTVETQQNSLAPSSQHVLYTESR